MKNLLVLIFGICLFTSCQTDSKSDTLFHFDDVKTILLVRHAEKADQSKDPPLSALGLQRAERLGAMLKNHPVKAVYSSDYDRTKSTAAPIANAHNLDIQIYGTSDLTQLKSRILKMNIGEMAVVVGHSNTTPVMVKLLDDKSAFAQIDESDYENIFIVKINQKGEVTSIKTTFDAYEAAASEWKR